jgi:hypothetical protein
VISFTLWLKASWLLKRCKTANRPKKCLSIMKMITLEKLHWLRTVSGRQASKPRLTAE